MKKNEQPFIVAGTKKTFSSDEMKKILMDQYDCSTEDFVDFDDEDVFDFFKETISENYIVSQNPSFIGIPLTQFDNNGNVDMSDTKIEDLVYMIKEMSEELNISSDEFSIMTGMYEI